MKGRSSRRPSLSRTAGTDLLGAIRGGDRRALARAITLAESRRPDHRSTAETLLECLLPIAETSLRIGVSGMPGVGKSTCVEALGLYAVTQGHRVAVLAVDPTSPRGGGSLLGDKTRMTSLAARPEAFIRPSPSGTARGGVARRTREAILLCEAAGYDRVIVETVGVGQADTAVADMVDVFVLLLAPGGGDQLQGLKRGIVEMADLLIVNKADGALRDDALRVQRDYQSALHLMPPGPTSWTPPVLTCSALTGEGTEAVWDAVGRFVDSLWAAGGIDGKRTNQARAWLWNDVTESLLDNFRGDPRVAAAIEALETRLAAGAIAPHRAASDVLALFRDR